MYMRLLLCVLVTFAASLGSVTAYAWGDDGHRLICGLSLEYMTPDGKAFVKNTLALGQYLDGNGKNDFPDACVWPDKVKYSSYKGTYEQHFLDVPKDAKSIDLARDCAAMDCVAVGIQRSLTYLSQRADGKRQQARKAAALRFLGHYIGDLHQPLHIANIEDWGGNKIKVKWFGEDTNLHAVWDVKIIEHAGLRYPDSIRRLEGLDEKVGSTDVLEWMRESFRLARSHAYPAISGKPLKPGDDLGEAYYLRSEPIVLHQLAKAGVRLAYLIDKLAEGKLDTNILIH